MIKKNNRKSFRQSIDDETIKMIELLKPFQKKKQLRTNIIFRKPTYRYLNKPSNSKLSKFSLNLSYKNPLSNIPETEINKENKNQECSDEKLFVSKYLNESMPNEKNCIAQSSLNSKLNSYRQTINYSGNPHKNIIALYTHRDPKKNKLPILDIKNKNSLLKKTRKTFLTNRDYKDVMFVFERMVEYKKKIRRVNSSFSQESLYNFEKRILKDMTDKNFLFNASMFNDSKDSKGLNYSKISKKKIFKKIIPKIKLNSQKEDEKGKEDLNLKKTQKYDFIENPNLINATDINSFKEKLDKEKKNMEKIIEVSINSKQDNHFTLVRKSKFDKDYQNLDIYEKHKDVIKEIIEKNNKKILDENVFKDNLQLLEHIRNEEEKINTDSILKAIKERRKNIDIYKQSLKNRFQKVVVQIASFLKQRKITDDDLNTYKKINHSFTYPETSMLIDAIKKKELDLCYEIVDNNKCIVLDFDYFYLTPLHWAVKRNFYKILPTLLDYGSMVDAIDISGETPLHIAVKNNYYDCACVLLFYIASPFVKNKSGETPIDCTKDFDMKNLMNKIINLHYSSYFQKNSVHNLYIQSGLWAFIKEEFKNKLHNEVIEYFNDKKIEDIFVLKY